MFHTIDYVVDFELMRPHTARFRRLTRFPYTTDTLDVYIDRSQILRTQISSFSWEDQSAKKFEFYLDGQPSKIFWKWSIFTGDPKYIAVVSQNRLLAVYGKMPSFQKFGLSGNDNSSSSKITNVQILREELESESFETVGEDEFPLDNKAGSDVLSVEHEVSKTLTNTFSTEINSQLQAQFSISILDVVKSQISGQLSQNLGQSIGESITKKQKLSFSVKPGHSVSYLVRWRAKVRKGQFKVVIGSTEYKIPFEARLGLFVEIAST